MASFDPTKLHVENDPALNLQSTNFSRKYTLTHSDMTGDLFLTIAPKYNQKNLKNLYAKLMRDEVLGCWEENNPPVLHIHCHVSGGLVIGPAKWRDSIFRQHLPMVLEAICYGDRQFLIENPECLLSPILVHFHAKQNSLDRTEKWGIVQDYLKSHKPSFIDKKREL
jgi:hypothetical protein